MPETYLDYASTEPLRGVARTAIEVLLESGFSADPSRVHSAGRYVRYQIEAAREQVAEYFGVTSRQVIFTSGATESVHLATYGALERAKSANPTHRGRVVSSPLEHSSVRLAGDTFGDVIDLEVDCHGQVSLSHLDQILTQHTSTRNGVQTPISLVNCQYANHELGTLQPVREVFEMATRSKVLGHCDATIAAGHVRILFDEVGCDLMSVSAHKLGGPPGIGALIVRSNLRLPPLLRGGSQERLRRAGMENLVGIVGFGAACEELTRTVSTEHDSQAQMMEDLFFKIEGLPNFKVLGSRELLQRTCNIVTLSTGNLLGEALVLGLDRRSIYIHSGSSCSSEILEPSPIVSAIGQDPDTSIRVSFGWATTREDLNHFLEALVDEASKLQALTSGGTRLFEKDSLPGPRDSYNF